MTAIAERLDDLEHYARLANDEGDYDEARRYLAEIFLLDNDARQRAADQRELRAESHRLFLEHLLAPFNGSHTPSPACSLCH